jgi:hypothetical protein
MLEKIVTSSLADLSIGGAISAMELLASVQAMLHSMGHYSGEWLHSVF